MRYAILMVWVVVCSQAHARTPFECPRSTVARGTAPPAGTCVWCEKIDSIGNAVKHGPWILWNEGGQMLEMGAFRDGLEDGFWTYWWENGRKKAQGRFENGVREGRWDEWHQNGRRSWRGRWRHGALDGIQMSWYENGSKASECRRDKGILIGVHRQWHDNRRLKTHGRYLGGRKGGRWVAFD